MNIFKPTTAYFLFLILLHFSVSAQNETLSCGTTVTNKSLQNFNKLKPQITQYEQAFFYKQLSKNASKVNVLNAIPIKAHIVRNSNGNGGLSISQLNAAISSLNSTFSEAYLSFFLCDGINYIDSDALCHLKKGQEATLTETHNVSGLINIYFIDYIENESDESICGYADNEGRNDVIVMKNSCTTNGSSLAHEMGHFFSLLHTHGSNDNQTTELVDGSNCDTDGDGICDTPADPKLTTKNVNNFCEYIGTTTDAKGYTYKPLTNNIMSYAMKGCRTQFTQQQLARMYAFYLTAKNYLACPDFNANVTADVSETCNTSLTVNFSSSCKNITKWEWDVDSDGIVDYTTQNPTHTFTSGIYDVTLKVSNKQQCITKTYSKLIKVGNIEPLFSDDFEAYTLQSDLNWTATDVTKNGYNWLLNTGETTSVNTGPVLKSSSTKQANTYIYAEASGAKEGDVATLVSPCIEVMNANSELEFSYHMFGNGIGELHIDIKTANGYINDVIPPFIGAQQKQQSEAFYVENIDLSAYLGQTINVRFRAVRGRNWDGDIAIDNVIYKTIDVPITDTVKIYPNPMVGDLIYVKANSKTNLSYEISNMAGKVMLRGTLVNEQINVSNLNSGMYLLTLIDKKSRVTKKMIR